MNEEKHVIKLTKRTPEEQQEYWAVKMAKEMARINELTSEKIMLENENSRLEARIRSLEHSLRRAVSKDLPDEARVKAEAVIESLEEQNAHLRVDSRNQNENIERYQRWLREKNDLLRKSEEEVEKHKKEVVGLTSQLFTMQTERIATGKAAQEATGAPVILHRWESGERPIALKLTKTTKGYTWEISIKGTNAEKLFEEVEIFEAEVRLKYGEDRWKTVVTSGVGDTTAGKP